MSYFQLHRSFVIVWGHCQHHLCLGGLGVLTYFITRVFPKQLRNFVWTRLKDENAHSNPFQCKHKAISIRISCTISVIVNSWWGGKNFIRHSKLIVVQCYNNEWYVHIYINRYICNDSKILIKSYSPLF